MQEFSLTRKLAVAVLAAGAAAMAQAQTPPAGGAQAPSQTAREITPAPPAPTGNIVALPSKVAVIAIRDAIMATKEGEAAGNVLKAKYAPKQNEFAKREADIQSLQEQLKKGSATMSADAKDKLEREIDGKTKSLQRDAQDANDDSQQDLGKVYNELGDKMLQIIEQYAYQNGYAAVLDVSNQQTPVLWAAPSSNITADIIKLYDQAHPAMASAQAPDKAPAAPAKPPVPPAVKK